MKRFPASSTHRALLPLVTGPLLQGPVGLAQPQAPPLYDNLGQHHASLSIRNPQAQAYFDQGLYL